MVSEYRSTSTGVDPDYLEGEGDFQFLDSTNSITSNLTRKTYFLCFWIGGAVKYNKWVTDPQPDQPKPSMFFTLKENEKKRRNFIKKTFFLKVSFLFLLLLLLHLFWLLGIHPLGFFRCRSQKKNFVFPTTNLYLLLTAHSSEKTF